MIKIQCMMTSIWCSKMYIYMFMIQDLFDSAIFCFLMQVTSSITDKPTNAIKNRAIIVISTIIVVYRLSICWWQVIFCWFVFVIVLLSIGLKLVEWDDTAGVAGDFNCIGVLVVFISMETVGLWIVVVISWSPSSLCTIEWIEK